MISRMGIHRTWLLAVLDNALDEVYFIDCNTGRFCYANQTALDNLQYGLPELEGMTPLDLAPELGDQTWRGFVQTLDRDHQAVLHYEARQHRRDGTVYPLALRLFRCPAAELPVYIAIGNDQSAARATASALQQSESRYQAIVSNIPGLVFQCHRQANGEITFPYLSERSSDLLGVEPQVLQASPALFFDLVMADDLQSLLRAMETSARTASALNWQGKIWITNWQDVKWISIRATPHCLPGDETRWDGVITNITQTKHEEMEIKRSHAQMAELSAHIQSLKEQERTRIAREIHDDLGGNLTAIKMALTLVKRRCGADAASLEKVGYAEHLVDRTIESIHRISGDLRPSVLDFGLVAAIEWQAGEFERLTGIVCHVSSEQEDVGLGSEASTALFRIFQEALTNIGKHAQATQVDVELHLDETWVWLEVVDNGRGMQQSDRLKPDSFGLRGMMERVDSLHGLLDIESSPGVGTHLSIRVPVEPQIFRNDDKTGQDQGIYR